MSKVRRSYLLSLKGNMAASFAFDADMEQSFCEGMVRKYALSLFHEWLQVKRDEAERCRPKAEDGDVAAENRLAFLQHDIKMLEMFVRSLKIDIHQG